MCSASPTPPTTWPPSPVTSATEEPPFRWDEEERRHLRGRLDALYFHLYGLSREDAGYVLDTFPIVRRQDEARIRPLPHQGDDPGLHERLSRWGYRDARGCLIRIESIADLPTKHGTTRSVSRLKLIKYGWMYVLV